MRIRWIVLIIAVALVFSVAYRKMSHVEDRESGESLSVPAAKVTAAPTMTAIPLAILSQVPEADISGQLTAENREELKHCDLPSGSEVVTLDDLSRALTQNERQAPKREFEWRNVHFVTSDGEKRRLRLARDFSSGGHAILRLQLFTLDEEGLPVPIPVPTEDARNPSDEVIHKYLDKSRILETQEKETLLFGGARQLRLAVETKNGAVRSLEISDRSTSFQCQTGRQSDAIECKCLRHSIE
jgi:hypothetical protein